MLCGVPLGDSFRQYKDQMNYHAAWSTTVRQFQVAERSG
uniref:Uncharacterized protein n=1 Tax=Triticum urartu TaxID=4572 RepID=A0A8R7QNM3_TRIUA